jgi:hypothetical protein
MDRLPLMRPVRLMVEYSRYPNRQLELRRYVPINGVPNPSLYDGQTVTASVYLRVASGTLNTYLFLENTGDVGFTAPNQPVALTSSWQRFSITATNQNGLSQLALQIGGAETITSGQSLQIWGPQIVVGNSAAPYTPTQN